MSPNMSLENEISIILRKVSLQLSVVYWSCVESKNKHLTTRTKVWVYKACIPSILPYGAECWTTYRPKESYLGEFHTRCLRSLLGWEDKITNEQLFRITNSGLLSSQLKPKHVSDSKEGARQRDLVDLSMNPVWFPMSKKAGNSFSLYGPPDCWDIGYHTYDCDRKPKEKIG